MLKALILILAFGTATVYAADTTPAAAAPTPAAPPATSTPPAQPNLVGGYNDVSIKDKDVKSAADFAVQQINQGTLVKILAAQMQIVAGKNFAMQLVLNQNGVNYQYDVIVFVPLPSDNQPMQLTNVQAMGEYAEPDNSGQTT